MSVHEQRPPWLEFLDKTSFVVTASIACLILYTGSVAMAYFAAGAVLCSTTVKVLKRLIAQPRPNLGTKKSYGMPSTHSASITYIGIYIFLACLYLPIHNALPAHPLIRVIPPMLSIPWVSLVLASRVWLGYHTWPQVLVGFAYGFGCALFWFWLWVSGWNVYGNQLEEFIVGFMGW